MEPPTNDLAFSSASNEFFFVEACGSEGKRWRAELDSRESSRLLSKLSQALLLFRTHELSVGQGLLASVELDLRRIVSCPPSIIHFLWRYFFSIKAYLQYLSDDLDGAWTSLERAGDEIRVIIESDRFLLPLAIHCADFTIQKARIARKEREWAKIKHCIDSLEQMVTGKSPYCTLRTGEPIRLGDLERFFADLPLNEKQRKQAHMFLRGDLPPLDRIFRISERIFALPDMVVPYP